MKKKKTYFNFIACEAKKRKEKSIKHVNKKKKRLRR